jgi:type IV secretion system protein VirD4
MVKLREGKFMTKIVNSLVEHTLIIGGMGSGKTTGPLISSLLSIEREVYLEDRFAFSNSFIFDIKEGNDHYGVDMNGRGMIYPKTAGWAKHNGVKVIILNPNDVRYAKFNIFNEIDINKPGWIEQLEEIVQVIVDPGGNKLSKDPFWEEQGRTLLAARMAFELYKNSDKPKNKTTLQKMSYFFRNYDIEKDCEYSMVDAFSDMRECPIPYIKSAGFMYDSTVAQTLSGYISTAQNSLRLYVGEILGEITSDSTFNLHDLFYRKNINGGLNPPTWLYLVVPANVLKRLQPFMQLFMSLYFNKLTEKDDDAFYNKYPVRIFLDEFTKLGKFDLIGDKLGITRSSGGIFILMTQSLSDVSNLYGKNNIAINCAHWVIYKINSTDPELAEKISKLTGPVTVQEVRPTENITRNKYGKKEKTVSKSVNTDKQNLMTPTDIIDMPADDCLIFITGMKPIRAKKIKYFKDKELLRRSQFQEPYPDCALNSNQDEIKQYENVNGNNKIDINTPLQNKNIFIRL